MQGSLALHRGTLFVGRNEKTAHIQAFDLDGRSLGDGFSFRDARVGRSVAAGIALDDDRHVWVADTPSSRVRLFSVFGQEIGGLGMRLDEDLSRAEQTDQAGRVRCPVDVAATGDSDGLELWIASGGERRHAVQLFDQDGVLLRTLRPQGDPAAQFRDVRGIARQGALLYVAEWRAGCVQVFRAGEFHFLFRAPTQGGVRFEPNAVAPLADGRVVVAAGGPAGGLLLFDAAGRLMRVLANAGREEGSVFEPNDAVVEQGRDDRHTRLAAIDRDGDRVQVFTLEGRCYGSFEGLAC